MMLNTYSSCSSIISFGTSFGFNDYTYTNYYQNYRCPSTICACCCSINVNSSRLLLPINLNPSIFYGLRQSTLIQLPHSRRIVLGSNDRHCTRVSNFDVGCCGGECCCVKEQVVGSCREKCCVEKKKRSVGVDNVLRRSCKESRIVGVDNIRSRLSTRERDFRCNALEDADAMISMLSDVSTEECVVRSKSRKGSSKGASIVKRQHVFSENSKDGEDNEALGCSEIKSKKREEVHKRRKERQSLSVDEDRRSRRRESTSSYSTVSDLSKSESDTEVDVKKEVYVGESSSSHKKDSRKTGSVTVSEVKNQEFKSHKDEKDQQFTTTRHDSVRVGSSSDWDCRKKSEKKLTEEPADGSNRKESILHQYWGSQANESTSIVASSMKSSIRHQEEESISDLRSSRQSRSGIIKDDRIDYSKFSGRHEHSTSDVSSLTHSRSDITLGYQASDFLVSGHHQEQPISDPSFRRQSTSQNNMINQASEDFIFGQQNEQETYVNRQHVDTTTSSWRRSMQGEEGGVMVGGQSVQQTECEHWRTCGRSMQENKMETDIQQHLDISGIRVGSRWTTTAQSQSVNRHREHRISLQDSVEEESKLDQLYSEVQLNARLSAGKDSQHVNTDYGYVQNTLRSQQQSKTRMKKLEESSTTHTSVEYEERLLKESADKVFEEPESCQVLQTAASTTKVHSVGEEMNSPFVTDIRLYDEETHSASKVNTVDRLVEKHKLIDETVILTSTEVQGPVLQASITGKFSGEENSSQPIPSLISQPVFQLSSELQVNSELQLPIISSSSQFSESKSSVSEPITSERRGSKRTDLGSGGMHVEPLARRPSPSPDVSDSGIKFPTDALGSAQRLLESSTQIVGEFVEKMKRESSTSETQSEKKLSQLDNRHLLSQIDSDKSRLVKLDPSHSSGFPGTKEQSAEMVGVKDQSVDGASEPGSPDGATSASVISRRSGKSLWGIVSGIFRLRWASSSPVKTSQQSSPNDSTGDEASPNDSTNGETWFSGNEQEEGTGDSNVREEVQGQVPDVPISSYRPLPKSMPQEPSSYQPLPGRILTRGRKDRKKAGQGSRLERISQNPLQRSPVANSQKDGIRIMSLDEKLRPVELDDSAFPDTAPGGAVSAGMSIGAIVDLNISQQISVYSPQDLSVPSAGLLRRSDPIEEIGLGGPVLEGLSSGANIDLNLPQHTSLSSPVDLPVPSARRLRRTETFEEIEEGSSSASAVVSIEAKTDLNMPQQYSVSNRQDVVIPSGRQLRRTNAFEEIEEAEKSEEQTSSSSEEREPGSLALLVPSTTELKQSVESVDIMQSVVPVSKKADAELKQRKLQRTNKVIIERFDEWEDAYRCENEQRKVDEIFMREALAEAIKAADSWEVPVGAVLVQNGNIIARGYNLVEELRDSTAHAEMICIREASNVLRTWRLSDATLYVTLEPCPMCAGAILQARIGTLVWGAPNKLLGADGSWIRLFPEGMEGEQRSEIADKPAAPKHPFHPNMKIRRGVLESECAQAMQQFFQLRRKTEKQKEKKAEEAQPSCIPVPHRPSKLFHKMHGAFHLFCL